MVGHFQTTRVVLSYFNVMYKKECSCVPLLSSTNEHFFLRDILSYRFLGGYKVFHHKASSCNHLANHAKMVFCHLIRLE